MDGTLDQRVSNLEKLVAQLTERISGSAPAEKDWRATVGMLPDDEISREADRRGQEWRDQLREP